MDPYTDTDASLLYVAADRPWMGLTAYVGDEPYLITGFDGRHYTLEGVNHKLALLNGEFTYDITSRSKSSAFVAASRADDSPLREGSFIHDVQISSLVYDPEEGAWAVEGHDGRIVDLHRLAEIQQTPGLNLQGQSKSFEYRSRAGRLGSANRFPILYYPEADFTALGVADTYHQDLSDAVLDWLDEQGVDDTSLGAPYQAIWYAEDEGNVPNGVHFQTEVPVRVAQMVRNSMRAPVFVPKDGKTMRVAAIRGTFFNRITQLDVNFEEDDFDPQSGSWDVIGDDGQVYILWKDGSVEDSQGNLVGQTESPMEDPSSYDNEEGTDRNYGDDWEYESKVSKEPEGLSDRKDEVHDPLKCPNCNSHTVSLLVPRIEKPSTFRCLACGERFDHSVIINPDRRFAKAKDFLGREVNEGWYEMTSRKYRVPDKVQVVRIDDGVIVAHHETDPEGAFPFEITGSMIESEEYVFEPLHSKGVFDFELRDSNWKTARRHFSPREQRELIEERGTARNKHKLDLSGTHYREKEASEEDEFLAIFNW